MARSCTAIFLRKPFRLTKIKSNNFFVNGPFSLNLGFRIRIIFTLNLPLPLFFGCSLSFFRPTRWFLVLSSLSLTPSSFRQFDFGKQSKTKIWDRRWRFVIFFILIIVLWAS
eukprot:Lithocolla_globosa_v1_NODE_1379_length_2620_cov_34.296686.p5 type:complete len:112 gc:universal NODE_1379_length_2620_cov_34.296686:836-501(-)